jgi:hypothetical protein
MKKCNLSTLAILLTAVLYWSCAEKEQALWTPGPIEDCYVTPIPGGAIIHYAIPDDRDILYVMAEYERNGNFFTEKASVHKNVLTVEGFTTSETVQVTLYKVNRKEQKSEPVYLTFEPLESPIKGAFESLSLIPVFGGVRVSWENPARIEMGMRLMVKYDDGLKTEDMYFSTAASVQYPVRNLVDSLTTFAVILEDKWGNVSDTLYSTCKPFYEAEIPKPYVDARTLIPHDNISNLNATYPFTKTYDGITGNGTNGWLSASGSSGLSVTWDLKQVAKLSRFTLWPRTRANNTGDAYLQVNILWFEMWGTPALDPDRLQEPDYWLDDFPPGTVTLPPRTFKDDWVHLGEHRVVILDPSDVSGRLNILNYGNQFELPIEAGPVRYVRLFCREANNVSPPMNNYFAIGEISFHGDTNFSQE